MIYFLIWLAGFIAIQVAGRWSLRSEPTTHGQIVGRMAILVISVFWPVALAFLIVALVCLGTGWVVKALKRRGGAA